VSRAVRGSAFLRRGRAPAAAELDGLAHGSLLIGASTTPRTLRNAAIVAASGPNTPAWT